MELTRTQQEHRRICVTQPRREKTAGKLLGETAGIYKISQQTRKRVREKWKVECLAMHNHRHPQRCNTSSQQSYSRVLCGSLGREGGRSLRIHDNPPADLARERENLFRQQRRGSLQQDAGFYFFPYTFFFRMRYCTLLFR